MIYQVRNTAMAARGYLQLLRVELEELASVSSSQGAKCYKRAITVLMEIENQDDEFLTAIVDTVKENPCLPSFPLILKEGRKALEMLAAIPPAVTNLATFRPCDPNQDTNCEQPNCDTYPSNVDVDAAKIAVATLDLLAAIAEAAMVVIPQEVLGFPNPAYIAAAAAYGGLNIDAKIAAEAAAILERLANINANCVEDAYNEMLRGICCTTNIIKHNTEEIIAKADIIISLAEDIKKTVDIMSLRQIEEVLASCGTLTSLYLPKVFGGHLEEVAGLVQSLIDQSKAAGLTTCDAQSFFYIGLVAMGNGEYKKAYKWFLEAYQQLICCK